MRYTRYDYKKKNKKFGTTAFFIVLGISICFVSIIISALLLNNEFKGIAKVSSRDVFKEREEKFLLLQCGLYKNRDNAESVKSKLSGSLKGFIIQEDDVHRVLAGVFLEGDGELSDKVKEKGIENIKHYLSVKITDPCEEEIVTVIKGNIEILKVFVDETVESVNTSEFKEWVKNLKEISTQYDTHNMLIEYKDYISKMSEKIERSDLEDNYSRIYNILKEMMKK